MPTTTLPAIAARYPGGQLGAMGPAYGGRLAHLGSGSTARGNVVFRTDPGTKFDAAVHEPYVAFEADWVGPSWQIGWSVVVRGQAHVVTGPEELQRVRRLPLLPWAEGDKEKFVSVDTMLISGRRFNGG